ncbi:methyltransferase domain-containing protein [Alkalihalobacterium chitinilyticum]|uniref:Methyltransferase domain-containing protein n=1 Tax=Alkalihalobacterium chitinilyticum TaxID=2980103 RepID=A0ABT5VD73_9BACI|nr:methyltransferase domain-containing protein [Alkalihalobacterium chitinilyticum]MDE5412154.1 methyltransferase domain-containing protein [Alkalihalobacterium chitinilyticum]
MGEYKCDFCGFQYKERNGDTKNGIPIGTPFEQLAGSLCNRCGMQGERHKRQLTQPYIGLEAEYFDLFTGKSGVKFFKQMINTTPEPTVLELGVGTARIAYELAVQGVDVTGLDTSEDMLAIAEKKRKRLSDVSKLTLIQENALDFNLSFKFTHILLTEGFLQHCLLADEQLQVLANVKKHLIDGGLVAVDLIVPPNERNWKGSQCKQWGKKRIYKTIEGETLLNRQTFETTITYETYEQNNEVSRFKVDREYSLILPREMCYLLNAEGFEVIDMFENYQTCYQRISATTLIPQLAKKRAGAVLRRDETLDESINDLQRNLQPFKEEVWTNGGYPIPIRGDITDYQISNRWTIIAKYKNKENEYEKN